MVSVFIPSSPTAFSGYVLMVPRESVIELPITVEEAMRMLISGGVIQPGMQHAPMRPSQIIAQVLSRDPKRAATADTPSESETAIFD
jgi:uncharacterized membrane protein